MVDREALYDALRNADAAGDTAAAQRLADYIRSLPPVESTPAQVSQRQAPSTPPAAGATAERSADGTLVLSMSHGPQDPQHTGSKESAPIWQQSHPVANFVRGLFQGATDLMAGEGQSAIHQGAAIIQKLFPGTELAARAGQRVRDADQFAAQRERQYQDATPGSVAAGVGRLLGGAAPTIGGALPLSVGRTLAMNALAKLGVSPAVQGIGGFAGASAGSALYGAGLAAQQPVTEGDYSAGRASNVVSGGVVGAVVPGAAQAIARGGQAVVKTARNIVEPFSEAGQERIANRIIQRFAQGGPTDVNATQYIPGSQPTLAQATGNPGLAGLERTIRNDPFLGQQFVARDRANAEARTRAFEEVAGDPSKLDFFRIDRDTVANDLYKKAIENYKGELTPYLKGQITQLLKRPSITEARKTAQRWAIERGEKPDPAGSLRALHDVKTALDDQISEQLKKGKMAEARALQATKDKLLNVMEKMSPDYAEARATYHAMSRPIDAMEFLQGLRLTDQRGNITLSKVQNALQTLMRERSAPGPTRAKALAEDQINVLLALRDDLLRADNLNLGRAVGSNTVQNIATTNLLSDALPFGNRLAQTALGGIAKRVGNIIYAGSDEAIRQQIANRLLDLSLGRQALDFQAGLSAQLALNPLVQRLAPYTVPSLTTIGVNAATP